MLKSEDINEQTLKQRHGFSLFTLACAGSSIHDGFSADDAASFMSSSAVDLLRLSPPFFRLQFLHKVQKCIQVWRQNCFGHWGSVR